MGWCSPFRSPRTSSWGMPRRHHSARAAGSTTLRSRTLTERLMRAFDVRAPSPDTPAGSLSGGNQQKLIIARELHREPDALLAVQPTRGLDVGAIEFVHKQLVAERDKGRGVLLISFDLDEVMDLSDRILVLWEGRIVGDFLSGTVTRDRAGSADGGSGSG